MVGRSTAGPRSRTPAPVPARPWFPPQPTPRTRRGARRAGTWLCAAAASSRSSGSCSRRSRASARVLVAIELGASRRSVLTLAVGGADVLGRAVGWPACSRCAVTAPAHCATSGWSASRRADVGPGRAGVRSSAASPGRPRPPGLILVLPDESYGESTVTARPGPAERVRRRSWWARSWSSARRSSRSCSSAGLVQGGAGAARRRAGPRSSCRRSRSARCTTRSAWRWPTSPSRCRWSSVAGLVLGRPALALRAPRAGNGGARRVQPAWRSSVTFLVL